VIPSPPKKRQKNGKRGIFPPIGKPQPKGGLLALNRALPQIWAPSNMEGWNKKIFKRKVKGIPHP